MVSELAWLDHSDDDRHRMREVIDLFKEKGTLDELGIGAIRNALSDLLFPGTSTIQTRPRYFLLVPWAFLRLERERIPSARAAARARDLEVQQIRAVIKGGEDGGDVQGAFGIESGVVLQRLPSVAYWGGLSTYRIRLFRGSIEDLTRSLDGFHRRVRRQLHAESDEIYDRLEPNWHRSLPDPPADLWQTATMSLRKVEAEYLQERIAGTQPTSMLASLLRSKTRIKTLDFPWDYAGEVTPKIASILTHARNYSEVIHGAALLYNFLLARQAITDRISGDYDAVLDDYAARIDSWVAEIDGRSSVLASWDWEELFELARLQHRRITPATRSFVSRWIELATSRPESLRDDHQVAELIRTRELQMKGNLARFRNRRALELWNTESGTGRLNYRWPVARLLVLDVRRGLTRA